MDLPLIWGALIALAVFIYVVLDGFDLGIGILFPFSRSREERDLMMSSVAPVWDGNETWLVLGGGGLMAAFPLAYAILMPAFYPLVIAMLLGLVFRGVAFEYRFKTQRGKPIWNLAFTGGSLIATLCQGLMIGAFLQGVEVSERAYGGGWFDWLTPFSVFCGVALVVGYVLLGANWLVMKTEGDLQARSYRIAAVSAGLVVFCITVVSVWLPAQNEAVAERWFSFPASAVYWLVPFALALLATVYFYSLHRRDEVRPYLLSLGFCVIAFAGFGISIYPYIVPRSITVWEAAAPPASLSFILVGALILLPIILAYTGYAYWVFRGKSSAGEGYH